MSRAASPVVKVGFLLIVLMVAGAKIRAADLPICTQEFQRCLAACRAVCSRRLADDSRDAHMTKTFYGSVDRKSLR